VIFFLSLSETRDVIYASVLGACLSQHVAFLQNELHLILASIDKPGSTQKYPEVNTSSRYTTYGIIAVYTILV